MFRVTKGCVQSKDNDDDDEFICEKIHPDYLFGHCRPEVPFEKLRPNLKYSSMNPTAQRSSCEAKYNVTFKEGNASTSLAPRNFSSSIERKSSAECPGSVPCTCTSCTEDLAGPCRRISDDECKRLTVRI
ncbi:hypothetical protein TYRP_008193 [Tyrophagus putrescentiae]|nr:hypothetical protein TYRP_008193 [Tyrophagus putrescentiae]